MQPEHHGSPTGPFSQRELDEFHRDDINSGKAVIILMSAIFSVGLVLYTIVAIYTYPR